MSDKDRYELKIAGLLHDCGKVTTPVHVVDKATKLETIYDRIHLVDTRFEVLKRDAEIELLKEKALLVAHGAPRAEHDAADARHRERLRRLDDDRAFLRACNIGGEAMREADMERVKAIARYRWTDITGHEANFLSEDELKNLTIRAGTLTGDERQIINHHIVATIKMLEALPWPQAPEERAGVRRRPPRAHGRQGLSEGPDARADVGAGARHGHRRHLRGAHRQGPALQEGQDAVGVAGDPRQDSG